MSTQACRIACVQLNPQPGQVSENVERVKELTKDLAAGTMDMLVLPEMALTGYVFANNAAIKHMLEDPYNSSSPSLQLAKELAIRLQCYVIVGCPVKSSSTDEEMHSIPYYDARPATLVNSEDERAPPVPDIQGCYNAALLVDAQGHLVHVFRKHFNYEDDKRWACEGPGFQNITLPGFGKVCIAVCMDLNPYDFQSPFESYEVAKYCQQEEVDLLIMPMAWLMCKVAIGTPDDLAEGPNASTINYWATRLTPFLESESTKRDFFFVSCNRTGTEQDSKFAGSSCALHFKSGQGSSGSGSKLSPVALLGAMSRQESVEIFTVRRYSA